MSELQSKKALRRNNLTPEDLPQNLRDKYDELLDIVALAEDEEIEDDERTELEVKITAKDESFLRLVRRHAREIADQKAKEKAAQDGKGGSGGNQYPPAEERRGRVTKYL
jgi:hypothetical protein